MSRATRAPRATGGGRGPGERNSPETVVGDDRAVEDGPGRPGGPGLSEDPRAWRGHVVVCGLAGIGLRVIEQLHLAGVRVVLVDADPEERLLALVVGWGVPHLRGGARLAEALAEAGLEGARAVVCAERTELATLETALLVRELDPRVRVVVQMANEGVGRALGAVIGNGAVLDVASLTAPSFVEACRSNPLHEMAFGGERFAAARTTVREGGTFRHLYGDLVPVAAVARSGPAGGVVVCPGRDHLLEPGDAVTLVGTPGELEAFGVVPGERVVGVERGGGGAVKDGPLGRAAAAALSLLREADRPLRVAFGLLVGLVLVSTVVLDLSFVRPGGGRLGVLDALYFTVEVLSTVGFGDFSFAGQSVGLEVFGIVLIVLGLVLVTTMFALLTNLLVSRRIAQSLGRLRVPRMRNHVVVIGLGSIGLRVVEGLLGAGEQVVVVEEDGAGRYLDRARALGVPVIVADATQAQTLESVNLSRAKAVAALTSDGLTNIEVGLAVRDALAGPAEGGASPVPVVLRVFDRRLARTVESGLGFDLVRSTAALAAPFFVGAALGLSVLSTFYVEDQPLLVARLEVARGGGLEGLAMAELSTRVRVLALRRAPSGQLEHPPRRGTRFAAGDEAYLVGPYEELIGVLRRDERQQEAGGDA